jgi:hypothetical protein
MFKSLMRSSLDNYVLPGTATGTDILWIYLIHWKRDMHVLCLALVYLVTFSQDPGTATTVGNPSRDTSHDHAFDQHAATIACQGENKRPLGHACVE